MIEAPFTPLTAVARDDICRKLQARGIQPTPQRIDIAALFLAGDLHLSADQVIARVGLGGRPVSKATVYNTLGLLAERGLLSLVRVDSTRLFYDSNTRPHSHFYNVDEGELTDVETMTLVVDTLPPAPPGTHAEGVDVVIRVRNLPARGE